MTNISESDDKLINANVEFNLLHSQDTKLLEGYRTTIDKLEAEVEFLNQYLERVQRENARLLRELEG